MADAKNVARYTKALNLRQLHRQKIETLDESDTELETPSVAEPDTDWENRTLCSMRAVSV